MYAKIESLELFPERCSQAPEDEHLPVTIRNTFYGSYRIIFTIRGNVVCVVHIRHGHRQPLGPDML